MRLCLLVNLFKHFSSPSSIPTLYEYNVAEHVAIEIIQTKTIFIIFCFIVLLFLNGLVTTLYLSFDITVNVKTETVKLDSITKPDKVQVNSE